MNPHISVPRQHAGPANLGGSTPTSRRSSVRMPRFFKRSVDECSGSNDMVTDLRNRLFKFPQMDFEMAIWEMTSLLIAPKKVFKSIYYHVSAPSRSGQGKYANWVLYRNVSCNPLCADIPRRY